MTVQTEQALREQLETTVADMKTFANQCDAKGTLSAEDREKLNNYSATVTDLVAQIKASGNAGYSPDASQLGIRSLMESGQGGTSAEGRNAPGLSFGAKAAAAVRQAGGQLGIKALVSGTIDVPSPILSDVVRTATLPTSFLDLIRDRHRLDGTNTYSFLRQTARTHNAAPVADGALKPTSVYTVTDIEDRARVIAHLSEAIPERYFADHRELERFLTAEMEAGLLAALEAQVANGDGLGENMTGILNTSGTTAVPYADGGIVTTARKALTAMRNIGEQPTAWVLNPTDDESFDLEKDGNMRFLLDQEADLWRIPRVTSAQVPTGTGILADWRQARLIVREDAQLAADRSADNFKKNLVQLRLEGRYGFAVLRPAAFAVVDLTAPAVV
jgi:HK97 family phage major capsid protein